MEKQKHTHTPVFKQQHLIWFHNKRPFRQINPTHKILSELSYFFFLLAAVGPAAVLTRHVHHPAVAVLHDVPRFAVNPAGGDAVHLEKARLQSLGLALSPRRRQVGQLQVRKEGFFIRHMQ